MDRALMLLAKQSFADKIVEGCSLSRTDGVVSKSTTPRGRWWSWD